MKYYNFKAENNMNCDVRFFANKDIYQTAEKTALEQLFDASKLPKIVGVVGMPDLHQGYGLPIGGVMASKLNDAIISPGAVGFDINCGVRILTTNLHYSEIKSNIKNIMRAVQKLLPAGLGENKENKFSRRDFSKIIKNGVPFLVEKLSIGENEDIINCEDNGAFPGADDAVVPEKAYARGFNQLGTLGSGNHFLEMQFVDKVYDNIYGFEEKQIVFMLHTGSRAFGHETAKQYTEIAKKEGINVKNKNLASFHLNSKQGQNYRKAMAAAANFAYANRHIISNNLRNIIKNFYPQENIKLFYDISHNIAREEEINEIKYLVHRKGAARLKRNGKAILPGSMGTFSYLIKSKNTEAAELSYYSTAHGAGRKMSRRKAKQNISQESHLKSIKEVKLFQSGKKNIMDESPLAYKDIDMIIKSFEETGLAEPALRFKPIAVLKG
ncbi:MAG: RtcB family protein [bacterium]